MTTIKKTIAAALAALTLVGASATVSPASAKFNNGAFFGGLIGGLVIGAIASHASEGGGHGGYYYRGGYGSYHGYRGGWSYRSYGSWGYGGGY